MRYSGWGVHSLGPVGDFLEANHWLIWKKYMVYIGGYEKMGCLERRRISLRLSEIGNELAYLRDELLNFGGAFFSHAKNAELPSLPYDAIILRLASANPNPNLHLPRWNPASGNSHRNVSHYFTLARKPPTKTRNSKRFHLIHQTLLFFWGWIHASCQVEVTYTLP